MNESRERPRQRLTRSDLALLAVGGGFWPLSVLSRNTVGMPHPERLVAVAGIAWAAGALVAVWLVGRGAPRRPVVRTTFVGQVLFMSGGRLVGIMPEWAAWVAMVLVVVFAATVFTRLDEEAMASALTTFLVVAVLSGIPISLYASLIERGADSTTDPAASGAILSERPDIFVVVLDGYPGLRTLDAYPGRPTTALVEALEERGLHTPESAWSSYWSTALSVPSLVNMACPVTDTHGGSATEQELYETIGGANVLVEMLTQNGYTTHMVESGWSGSSCGPAIDHCVPSGLFDEAMSLVLNDTVLGPSLSSTLGSPFTIGSEKTMDWLLVNASTISADPSPNLVFAHLISPHPPFYLDHSCNRVVDSSREGSGLYRAGVPNEQREAFFEGQMYCVNDFMLRLADAVEIDDVLIYVSDHGSARHRQLNLPPSEWEVGHISERFNVFMAVRVRRGCDIGEVVMIPNLLRRVLSCYASDPLPDLDHRMFIPLITEVPTDLVRQLTGADTAGG